MHILEHHLTSNSPLALILAIAYIMGLLASLTPCIYPMIPITVGIITSQQSSSMLRNFFLSLTYGIGIATVYAILGYISATSSLIFGQWVGHPLFIAVMVIFFVALALSLFGFYEIKLPRFLTNHKTRGGSLTASYLSGLFSGAAASPCLTPALALILRYVAQTGNPVVGVSVLFTFALGLSTLLIVVGTFSSSLSLLPRAGIWMEHVKTIFGFLLLIVAVGFLAPLIPDSALPALQGLVVYGAAIYYYYRSTQTSYHRVALVTLATFLVVIGTLLSLESMLKSSDMSLMAYIEGLA